MFHLFLVLYIFIAFWSSYTQIYEHKTLAHLLTYIPEESKHTTLIIFDLDNTIVRPETDFGSDQWFYYLWQKKQAQGYSPEQALYYLLPLYYQIQGAISLQLVEPENASLINVLQERHIPIIALTSRGFPIVKRTISQLHKLDIHFDRTAFFDNCMKEPHYQCAHGIIFCAGHKKDVALFDVLQTFHFTPTCIIFVDDKMNYVRLIADGCAQRDIPFIGIRYAGSDQRVAQFDIQQADRDFEFFDAHCALKLYS